jgi:hypothetical protein
MSDETTSGPDSARPSSDAANDGRRQTDRRKSQQPFEGPDRRKSDRRSVADRRANPRADGLADGEE